MSARRQHALDLFAPLGPTYDRTAAVLSFGQDPRWRRFLVSRIPAGARVLDVATGTGAVAAELLTRGCTVVGLDQSAGMLAVARERLDGRAELVEGSADALPFGDGEFEALTFTYLLRYVDDPAVTLRELARVVAPGGAIASLEFGLPRGLCAPRLGAVDARRAPRRGADPLPRLARGRPLPERLDPGLPLARCRCRHSWRCGARPGSRTSARAGSASAAVSCSGAGGAA